MSASNGQQRTPIIADHHLPTQAPKGWEWVRLRDVARLESGHTPSRSEPSYWEGSIRWLSLKDIKALDGDYVTDTADHPTQEGIDNSSARVLPKGTVALCRTASVGKAVILGCDMATSQDFVNWVCGPKLIPEYLLYAFRNSESEFDRLQQGTTHKTIYMPTVEKFAVLLPPHAEQSKIVNILGKADIIRRKREEAIRETEELLRSIYLEMFGDPATNPKKWPTNAMGDVVRETQYGTAEKSNSDGIGHPVLRMNNITYDGEIELTDLKWCEIKESDIERLTVKRGDLLFNRTNSPELVGKTAVWDRDERYAYAGYLFRVRFNEKVVLPDYISGFLNSAYGKKMLFEKAKPSNNMSNFSAGEFCRIELPVPEIGLQRRFADAVAEGKKLKARRRFASKYASDLSGSLVQRAFRAEL